MRGDALALLQGLTIGITAERRAEEQGELFRKRGAEVMHGSTLRIFSLTDAQALPAATLELPGPRLPESIPRPKGVFHGPGCD